VHDLVTLFEEMKDTPQFERYPILCASASPISISPTLALVVSIVTVLQ